MSGLCQYPKLVLSFRVEGLETHRLQDRSAVQSQNQWARTHVCDRGRLQNAHIPESQRHLVILPAKSHVVSLLLRFGHTGAQSILATFRLKYWPQNGIREIKRVWLSSWLSHFILTLWKGFVYHFNNFLSTVTYLFSEYFHITVFTNHLLYFLSIVLIILPLILTYCFNKLFDFFIHLLFFSDWFNTIGSIFVQLLRLLWLHYLQS